MATGTTIRGDDLDETLYNQYMQDETKLPALTNKVVAITGTTTGLGFHLARTAIVKGASVVLLLNRASDRSAQSESKLNQLYNTSKSTTVTSVACDLMDLESVKQAAKTVNEIAGKHGGLDVFCANAGVMMMSDTRTKDGFEVQMQTNQLSHALLMHLVWSSIEKAASSRGEARVVYQSSGARNIPNTGLQAKYFEKSEPMTLGGDSANFLLQALGWKEGPIARYHQSKLANSAFGMALHHKLQASSSKIKSVVCEPGYSVTPLQTTSQFMPQFLMWIPSPKQSPADGCLNAAMACFCPDAESGDFYVPGGSGEIVGPPKKVVAKGEPVKKNGDKLTCSKENQELVWESCQKALEIEFAA